MPAVESLTASQGAIVRPGGAIPGAAAGVAPGFGDALSALMAAVGAGAADVPVASVSRTDKAGSPSALSADETVTPPVAQPTPVTAGLGLEAGKASIASSAKATAPPKPATRGQNPAPPAAPATTDTATTIASALDQNAEDAPAAASAAREALKAQGAEPEANGAIAAGPPTAITVAQPPPPTLAAPIPIPTVAQAVPTPPPAPVDRSPEPATDRIAGAGSEAQAGPKAALAAATAALTPEAAAPVVASPGQSFAERVAAAALSAPATRPASLGSGKSAAFATGAAPSSVKPASAPTALDRPVTPVAVAAVETAASQQGGDHESDGASGEGGGFAPAGSAATAYTSPTASSAPPSAPGAGAPDTVASFAAALVQRLGQRVSRFQVVLNPEGLGQVDVSMKIDAEGALFAHIACDKDSGADALKARTGELAASLQQAGFSIAADALRIDAPPPPAAGSFSAGSDASGGNARDQRASPAAWRGADLTTLDAGVDLVPAAYAIAGRARGLDIRI